MGEVLDRLFVTSQKTGVPLNDLVSTLQSAGPVVRQFGLPIEQAAGLLATLDKAGVDAGPAIFGLRKAFTTFAKAGKEPKEALQAIIGQIQNLAKAGDLAAARKIGVDLFGARGVGIVDAAVNGKLSLEALTKTFDSTGKGIRATAASTSTMSAKLGVLKNNAQLALAELGGPLLNIATASLKAIVPVVQTLAGVFTKLPGPVQGAAVGMVALGAVAGPIARLAKGIAGVGRAAFGAAKGIAAAAQATVRFFTAGNATKLLASFGKAASSVLSFGKSLVVATANIVKQTAAFVAQKAAMLAAAAAQKVLTAAQWLLNAAMTANPIGLIVAGIAALAAGVFIAYKKFKPFRDIVNAVGRALRTAFNWVKKNWPLLLGILTGPFGIAIVIIKKFGPQILSVLTGVGKAILSFFAGLPGRIVSALSTVGSILVDLGRRILGGLLIGAKAALAVYLAFYVKLPIKILSLLAGAGKWLLDTGKKILVGLGKGVVAGAVAVYQFFVRLHAKILSLLGTAATWLIDVGLKVMRGLLGGITRGVIAVFQFFTELPGKVLAKLGNVAKLLFDAGWKLLIGFGDGIIAGAGAVLGWLGGLKDRILGAIGDAGRWLYDVGRKIIGGLLDGIKDGIGGVKDTLTGLPGKIISWKGPPAKDAKLLTPIGGLIIQGLIDGVAAQLPGLQKQLGVVEKSFTSAFNRGRTMKIAAEFAGGVVDIKPRVLDSVAPKLTLPPDAATQFASSTQQFVYQQNAPVYAMSDFERTVEKAAVKGMQNKTRKDGFVSGVRVSG